ncbi:MAG TPA: hypothetical protein VIK91_25135, partial [Nannocystis sp.]
MMKRTWLFVHGLAAMFIATGMARADEPNVIRFGGGSKGGGFDLLANALAEVVAREGRVRVEPQVTKGSCDNIHRLLAGELDAALVQY